MTARPIHYLSVCSGIEAATEAWHPLGWRAVAFAEIEPFPCAVLAHRYPDVPNLGDLTRYEEWPLELLAEVDVLVGGTPCQAFSVAGARQSLADDRGNFTLIYANLLDRIDRARDLHGRPPALCLWENVPGVLNTPDNALGCFLGRLAGEDGPLRPPGGRWTDAGYVRGPARAIAWRCLDAQYFGLAQRRDRVFLVASAGAVRVEEILFEREGLRRDSPPSRGTGERTATNPSCGFDVGGTLGPRVSRLTTDECAQCAAIVAVPEVADTLRSGSTSAKSHGKVNGTDRMTLIPILDRKISEIAESGVCPEAGQLLGMARQMLRPGATLGDLPVCMATGQASASAEIGIGTTLNCNHEAPIVAFSAKDHGADAGEISPTLRSMGHDGSHANGGGQVAVAFQVGNLARGAGSPPNEDVFPTLKSDQGRGLSDQHPCVAYDTTQITSKTNRCNPQPGDPRHPLAAKGHPPLLVGSHEATKAQREEGPVEEPTLLEVIGFNARQDPDSWCERSGPLLKAQSGTNGKGDGAPCVATSMAVRRLTPRECERLQGFPDDSTLIPYRGKPAADGPRYKALGNSKAVPVVRWLGRRIAKTLSTTPTDH